MCGRMARGKFMDFMAVEIFIGSVHKILTLTSQFMALRTSLFAVMCALFYFYFSFPLKKKAWLLENSGRILIV